MPKHEIKQCRRCGAQFECKASKPTHCHCADVELSEEQMEGLAERYDDCLCPTCLGELAAGTAQDPRQ